ncbi:hypothetical protein D8Y22_01495 [Salinadaptatus halalkaliphilus]|uniref:Uncharacterized protein n=1 Tax=Salinadaptatus halalkaliphilus TaxID=2419781 RepID=A0A4S3TQZ8_9EURY|nr:hypothetical protein [Salinadaptatus halalkaliphilus]THE66821.1 hypothetical protein D8Y22_01495 [Salinadaptatus halalkaliphilus]
MEAPEDDTGEPSHSLRGPIDGPSLYDFRATFERLEPMATGELDDPVDPTELTLQLADGIGSASSARLDVSWTTVDDYNVHYTDSQDRNCRWDVHPHDFPRPATDHHFHPPPRASNTPDDVAPSCIAVSEVVLVARAVHACWRLAYDDGELEAINAVENPP